MSEVGSQKHKIRVFIADDHAIVRQGIEKVLSKTPDMVVVGEAEDGVEVMEKIGETSADVLLLDIDMPRKNGWDVMKEMKIHHPKIPVIILTIFEEETYGSRFMKAGAAGFLNKKSAPANLVEAIRKVRQGGKYVSQKLADQLLQDLGKPSPTRMHENLSDREFQVFCMIVAGKKLKAIADELSLGITTVSTHRTRILEKLRMKTNAELIRYAVEHNLVR